MLGRGLIWTISSRRLGFRSYTDFNTVLNASLSNVSSNLSTERVLAVRLGRGLFLDEGFSVCGRRALDIAGDMDISSSRSGEGDAFRFLEGPVVDTEVAVSTQAAKTLRAAINSLDLFGERRVCSWKCGGIGGVARLFIVAAKPSGVDTVVRRDTTGNDGGIGGGPNCRAAVDRLEKQGVVSGKEQVNKAE